ncbi:MAG TPA: DUF1559 domain-containing protein [Gemmataceae bacterium]|nr:DUF1559 domain-containing protein [Gemmataceae bacterium]
MPRYDDEDDDRPRRRRPRDDEDDDDAPRSRRRRDEDEEDETPRRRRARDEDDDFPPPRKKKSSIGLILAIVGGVFLLCCGGGGFGVYYFFNSVVGEKRDEMESANNLKQIALGMHSYHDRNGGLPVNTVGPDGRPLLSWRVHLLPYVDEQALYNQFRLDEPWDGPTNRRLLDQMPRVYATPAERKGSVPKGNKTYYRGFSSPGAVFAPIPGRQPGGMQFPGGPGGGPPMFRPNAVGLGLVAISDGTSNTIAVVEAGDPVEWTKPDDLDASPNKPFPRLGGVRPKRDTFLVAMLDGSYRVVRRTTNEATLRAAVTTQGGEVVVWD